MDNISKSEGESFKQSCDLPNNNVPTCVPIVDKHTLRAPVSDTVHIVNKPTLRTPVSLKTCTVSNLSDNRSLQNSDCLPSRQALEPCHQTHNPMTNNSHEVNQSPADGCKRNEISRKRKRKFPGPAGLLPKIVCTCNLVQLKMYIVQCVLT